MGLKLSLMDSKCNSPLKDLFKSRAAILNMTSNQHVSEAIFDSCKP